MPQTPQRKRQLVEGVDGLMFVKSPQGETTKAIIRWNLTRYR